MKELLSLKGKQINIPVERLKRQDADQLFTNLLLSGITPDTINKINEQEWENSLWQLSYEQRQSMVEYRDAAQKLTLAGYDLATPGHAISDISQRLEAIDTVRKSERELAAEYKTLLQVRRYVKLANEPRFVKGPKCREILKGKIFEPELPPEIPEEAPHPDRDTLAKEKNALQKTPGRKLIYSPSHTVKGKAPSPWNTSPCFLPILFYRVSGFFFR